jgi:DHA2 family multidrug resistance protein
VSADFVPSQLIQALGQTAALIAFIYLMTKHIGQKHILTFGAFLQTVRLFGGELGVAGMTWFVRSSEQTHPNLIGPNVHVGDALAQDRLRAFDARAKAITLMGRSVQIQAYVLTYIDALTLVAMGAALCLVGVTLLRPAPPPAIPT